MPQSSRMMVTFWACFSQAATSLSAAACGTHETQAKGEEEHELFHARGLCHEMPRFL